MYINLTYDQACVLTSDGMLSNAFSLAATVKSLL